MLEAKAALDWIKIHKKVAIVGLSPNPDRPSHRVGKFLLERGFEIVPVNPAHEEILGLKAVKSLSDLSPQEVDWVDLFVNPARLKDLASPIGQLKPGLVWCQIGVLNEEFNRQLDEWRIPYTADICPKMEWEKEQ
ncbi:MAG: CoA-binding protein [Deltaproteobacteria bacterium]|nr:CoA-binding protein [Deltaproteobacteria bacterium]